MPARSNVVPMASPMPLATPQWPITGDAPDLLAIVQAQATTIHDNAALIDAYQGWLNAEQNATGPAIPATGNSTGTTSLTMP